MRFRLFGQFGSQFELITGFDCAVTRSVFVAEASTTAAAFRR